MIAPDKQVFKIHAGAAMERYTTLNTNLSTLSCGLEVNNYFKWNSTEFRTFIEDLY